MQLLNKNTGYAVRALLYTASNSGRFVPSTEIAQNEKIPLQYARGILQKLVKNGYMESKEGATGGVRLKVNPDKIRITGLIRVFQGNIQILSCMFRKKVCCYRTKCVLRQRIKKIEKRMVDEFNTISIGSLLKDLGDKEWKEKS